MSISKRIIALLLTVCFVSLSVSCNKDDSDETVSVSDTYDFTAGNTDYETTYYTTRMITLPCQSLFTHVFYNGTDVCVITNTRSGVGDDVQYEMRLFVCDIEGNVISDCLLDNSPFVFFDDVCDLDGERFVAVGKGADYVIYDYNGQIVKEAEGFSGDSEVNFGVCKTEDGFMTCIGNKVCHYNTDGEIIDDIALDTRTDGYAVCSLCGVFEQRGKYYGYGSEMTSPNSSCDYYYSLDFETDTVERMFRPGDMKIFPAMDYWGSDYKRNTCGDDYSGGNYLLEVDMENESTSPLADKGNILLCPPTYNCDTYNYIKVLDKKLFYVPYEYQQIDLTEIALLVPDDTMNLAERTTLVIQGAGLNNEPLLASAAYYYNVSQDEYFIKFDDLASRYGFSTPEGMQTTKLQLLARYSNGDTPDIFFGNFFDYNYMGENEMVIDMKPYLGNDPIYDRMTRSDGKIYQVFAGYTVQGYFGLSSIYGSDTSITEMPDIPDGQKRFGGAFSPDIVYRAVGTDLCTMYREGYLTFDNVLTVVEEAIEEGDEPDYQYTNYTAPELDDIRTGRASLFNGAINSMQSYYDMTEHFGGEPVYVGYPSVDSSVHTMVPWCLMAVSSSTEHADVCCDFIKTLMTTDVQRKICAKGGIPANRDTLLEMLDYLKNPDFGSEELKMLYSSQLIRDLNATPDADHNYPLVHVTDNMCENYLSLVDLADCVEVYDWGLWVMIRDEVTTYYNQGKSIEEVADALYSRLLVYAQENYG